MSILSTIWEWRSLIGWAVLALVLLAVLGFARPVVEALARTWAEFVLPILRRIAENPVMASAAIGGAAFLICVALWYFADRSGYTRAKGECRAETAVRERDALAKELENTRERLARLTEIMQKDATRALADAETQAESEARLDGIPKSDRICFDEPTARSLWGGR